VDAVKFLLSEKSDHCKQATYGRPIAIDTVGVWGSNPHAPTNFLGNSALQFIHSKSVTMSDKFCAKPWIELCHKREGGSLQ
jgi:hypothetical protein